MPVNNQRNILSPVTKQTLHRLVFFFCCGLLSLSEIVGQCTTASATPIPDNDSITLGFNVSGLANSNLASAAQGICGVEIVFNHESITDLTISLISPAGTVVQLIGPANPTANPTNLTTWDIQFIPCGMPANPDPGFSDAWTNLDPWAAIAMYNGDYHPYSGCLEDFNVGSANGQWLLIVKDDAQFDLGNIISVTLLFCDPTGLVCSECLPNAGTITPASIARCAGERILSSDVTVNFGNNIPPASTYNYEYLLVSGSTIIQSGALFSATPPVGNYILCGLSYLISDDAAVQALLMSGDYNGLQQDCATGNICCDLTPDCIEIQVTDEPDTLHAAGNICQGETFTYRGQVYNTSGIFYQYFDGPGLCDTVAEIRIGTRPLTVTIDEPDTLFCNSNQVTLNSQVSGAAGPFTVQWTTTFGNITSPPNLASITVNQAGPYFITVTDGICSGNSSVDVHADQGFPQVFVDGGTLTCTTTSIDLAPIYVPSDGSVQWNGPGGFTSMQPNVTVNAPGSYFLTITNQQGCSTTREVLISIDTITEQPQIVAIEYNCTAPYVTLAYLTQLNSVGHDWTGPNNFFANSLRIQITDPGLYTFHATFPNGCSRTATYFFDGDFTIPDISVPLTDTLNCNETIPLTVTSMTPGVTYNWQGPNAFSSNMSSIQVTQEGIFTASITAPNGCQNSASVDIIKGPDVFDYQSFTDIITCAKDSVDIGILSAVADMFQWLNYTGPDVNNATIHVGAPGIYTVVMTDTESQCMLTTTLVVDSDTQSPAFGVILDTITCMDPLAQLSFVPWPGNMYNNVFWELSDLTIVPGPNLTTTLAGTHNLHAVGENGCQGIVAVQIPVDTLAPFILVETDTILCFDTVQIFAQSLDSVVKYAWSGPGIISSLYDVADVDEAGIYVVDATGVNGCVNSVQVVVDSNYILPVYTLDTDTLRCDRLATLSIITGDSILQYHWYDPMDQLIAIDSTVDVNAPGQYTVDLQGINQCIAYDTITLTPVTYPVISITSDTFTCVINIATLQSHIDVQPASIKWIDTNDDTISMNTNVQVMDGGPFFLQVTGPNGCITRDTIDVPFDTISPHADIVVIGEVRCMERDVTFDGGGSTPTNILFDWSTIGGNITSDPAASLIDAVDSGRYQLIITRLDNGCKDTAEFHLLVSPDEIHSATLDITRPQCTGDDNGAIEITGVSGGIGPFLFQLEEGPIQQDSLFDQLSAGMYLLSVFDAAGCEYDTTITIPATTNFTVNAGPDIEIHIGETITLSGTSTLPDTAIQDQAWDSLGINLCVQCPEFDVSPWETTMYTFQVTSETGCVLEDEIQVFVVEKGKFFIANIFSPNGDNINDEIRLNPTPGVQKVRQWIIFDRWGDAVYGKTDFDPGDPSVFWNGTTSTGEFANPGVFPYVLEIQLINGNVELLHGNITLIR